MKLIIVCGLQGTGKTVASKKIVERINAVLLRTDVIRKELFKNPKYTSEESQKVYDEMFKRAERSLKRNKNVVLDATFNIKKGRTEAKRVAEKFDADFTIVEVVCDEDVVKERIEKRVGDESEARFEHYLKCKKSFESITEERIIIDNSGTLEDLDNQLNKYF